MTIALNDVVAVVTGAAGGIGREVVRAMNAAGATVRVGRRTPTVMQVNRKQQHILVDMATGTLSDDGVTMIWREIDWQCQSQIVWTLHKQPIP